MIVRDRPHGLELFFILRGSVLPHIAGALAACTLFAVVVTAAGGALFRWKLTFSTVPFSLIGLALAIFLGFRNSAAYDRFWEARKLWGDLLHLTCGLARQMQSLPAESGPAGPGGGEDPRAAMPRRGLAFVHALKHQLRGSAPAADLERFVGAGEAQALAASPRITDAILLRMGGDLAALLRSGALHPALAANVDAALSRMAAASAGCERIKGTPIPFAYTLLLHRTAWVYCFLLPFGLVETVGPMTPFVVVIVAYTFFGLAELGDQIEEPFGTGDNHLPLDAICREIEIGVLSALGDSGLPQRIAPVRSKLT